MLTVMQKITTLDGVPNFRDTGALPLQGGGKTRSGVLYRSAALGTATEEGKRQLKDSNITAIIDLRTESERQMLPDPMLPDSVISLIEKPIYVGNLDPKDASKLFSGEKAAGADAQKMMQELAANIPTPGQMYLQMLSEAQDQLVRTVQHVAERATDSLGVLVHCTAGKDRTGVSVALALSAVGVERAAIVDNYAMSQELLAGPWAQMMRSNIEKMGIPLVPKLDALITSTPPEAIETAFDWIDQNYGGAIKYLQDGGMTDEQLMKLRRALRD